MALSKYLEHSSGLESTQELITHCRQWENSISSKMQLTTTETHPKTLWERNENTVQTGTQHTMASKIIIYPDKAQTW